jgi:hypothetical protein
MPISKEIRLNNNTYDEKKSLKSIITTTVLMLFTTTVMAQGISDSLSYKTSISLGGNRRTGLNAQNNFTGAFNLKLNKSSWGFVNISDYAYAEANGKELTNDIKTISFVKKSFSEKKAIVPTFIHVFENSILYKINNRQSVKLGVTITPLEKRKQFWFFVGLGYDHTVYDSEIFINSDKIGSTRSFSISSVYLENEHKLIKDRLTLSYGLFYVQSLEEVRDFTLWFAPSLDIKISNTFAFSVKYDARFRNVHLVELQSFNDILTYSLKVSLSK